MEDRIIFSDTKKFYLQHSGRNDENITVAIGEKEIKIKDHLSHTIKVLSRNQHRKLSIDTGKGNDIFHIETKGHLSNHFSVDINAKEGHKLIIGTNDPMLLLKLNHEDNRNLVLPDNQPGTYEKYVEKIQRWNESNRKADGFIKSIKRKLVYFFGRDLKFRQPFSLKDKIKKLFFFILNSKVIIHPAETGYYTTGEHLKQLEAIARPGDILLRYQQGYLFDKYFVGTWQHAGLYYKKAKVIDAMGNGTYVRSIEQFAEADGMLLLRINDLTNDQINQAISYTFEQIGKSYSVDFNNNISEQYCSGLIINAYKYAGVLSTNYKRRAVVYPDDLLKIHNSTIIWTNRPDLLKRSLQEK